MEERKRFPFREAVASAYLHGFSQGAGASLEQSLASVGSELAEAPQRQSQVVESHAAGDLALRSPPGKGLLEESDGLGQLFGGRSQVRERGRQIVKDARAPAAFGMLGELLERDGETIAGLREVGRRAGASEEDGGVVEEAGPRFGRIENELGQEPGEVLRQAA